MRRGIGQRLDDLELLDDRARPPVRDDERQRVFMFRTNVDEMNVQSVDLGQELGQRVEGRFAFAPVVLSGPVPRELLTGRERHALRRIRDGFPFGPLRRLDAPAQFDQFRFRDVHLKRTDGGRVCGLLAAFLRRTGWGHERMIGRPAREPDLS